MHFPLIARATVLGSLLASAAHAQVVGPTDYIAYWNLDEGVGALAQDSSANSFSGAVNGAQWTSGVAGSALEFDGVDDFVELSDGNGYPDAIANLSEGTISVWFRFDSVPVGTDIHPILELGDTVLGNDHSGLIVEVGHFQDDTKLYFTIYEAGHVIPQCFDTEFNLQLGKWYHFAAVVGTGFNTGYLDGIELVNRDYNYGSPTDDYFFSDIPGPVAMWIGRGALANILTDQHLDGAVDELRIYDRALSSAEIAQYYQEMVGGGGCPPDVGPTHCDSRSSGTPLAYENATAPGVPQLTGNQVDLVILGDAGSQSYGGELQQLLNATPPIPGVSFTVSSYAYAGSEAWNWSTPGQEGYQRIDALIQNPLRPMVVLGSFTNNESYPIVTPDGTDPNYNRFVSDLIGISEHLYAAGSGADLVYLSAHRYKPANFLPCWNENCAMGGVMQAAETAGLGYLKPGPELHELSVCCYPSCYAADGEQPNALGRSQMAVAWHAFLVREFSGVGEVCKGSANSSGVPANLSLSGTTSLAANDLVLSVDGSIPQQFGLFFYAADRTYAPFGDGTLCLSGQFHRLNPAQPSDAFGNVLRALDNTVAPANQGAGQLTPGSTWNFQFWYRDPAAAAAGFNVSSAVSVTFQP